MVPPTRPFAISPRGRYSLPPVQKGLFMTDKTKELIVLALPTRDDISPATEYINTVEGLTVKHSAIIARAEDNEVVIYDDDVTPHEGAISGGTLGALMGGLGVAGLGAMLLPGIGPLIAIGIGAAAGGLVGGGVGAGAAKLMDFGINDKMLNQIAQHMEANQVCLVLELEGSAETLATVYTEVTTTYGGTVIKPEELT
jgi:uncharacterized membrane protein